jgi:hypothetical protein
MTVDWNHIQLLGWYDHEGRAYLVPLQTDGPLIGVIVTGIREADMPLLDMPVPEGARLQSIPEEKNPFEYAKEIDGFYAVGCFVEEGLERK